MKTKERILWVDIYKVLAISLVVLGHMHLNEKLNIAIYSFHMFAFFLISGYCTKDKMGGQKTNFHFYTNVFIPLIKQFLLPYYIFALLYVFIDRFADLANLFMLLFNHNYSFLFFVKNIVVTILYGTPDVFGWYIWLGPMWFLMSFICVRLMSFFIHKLICNRIIILIVAFILFVVGYLLSNINFLPVSFIPACSCLLFYEFGIILKFFEFRINILLKIVFSILGWLLLAIITIYVADECLVLASNTIPNNFVVYFVMAIVGCASLWFTSQVIAELFLFLQNNNFLIFVSNNTLGIMMIHMEIMWGINYLEKLFLPKDINVIVLNTTNFILIFLISISICYLIDKVCPRLIGNTRIKK